MTLNKTIRISEETYNELTRLGTLADSYDIVIKHLLEISKIEKLNRDQNKK